MRRGVIRQWVLWNLKPGNSRPYWIRSRWVGASCFCYLAPSACYIALGNNLSDVFQSYLAFAVAVGFAAISFTAFLSEFVHIPVLTWAERNDWLYNPVRYPPSRWGMRDRVLSSAVSSIAAIEGLARVGIVSTLIGVLISVLFIFISRCSQSSSAWVIRHSLWHVVSSVIPSILSLI